LRSSALRRCRWLLERRLSRVYPPWIEEVGV
jgi:hypothetical protein